MVGLVDDLGYDPAAFDRTFSGKVNAAYNIMKRPYQFEDLSEDDCVKRYEKARLENDLLEQSRKKAQCRSR